MRAIRRLLGLVLALAATCSAGSAATVEHTQVNAWGSKAVHYLADTTVGSTGSTVVGWLEGRPAGRSLSSTGQYLVRGSLYAGVLEEDADWGLIASGVTAVDLSVADASGNPIVAWATSGGLFASERMGPTWGAPQQLLPGRIQAVASVQPQSGVPAFIVARQSASGFDLLLVTRDADAHWSVAPMTSGRGATPGSISATRVTDLASVAPAWWANSTITVMAPDSSGVLALGAWSSAGTWRRIGSLGVRQSRGGVASANGQVAAYYGGRRGKLGNYQGERIGYPAGASAVYLSRSRLERLDCDVSAVGLGRIGGGLVAISSGGCGLGVGASVVGGEYVDLSPPTVGSAGYYGWVLGVGYGLQRTVVITQRLPDRTLWVVSIL